MDPRFAFRKGYDTDLIILRSLFALNPNTNLPISSSYLLTTDGVGGLEWESAIELLSTAIGVPNLQSTLNIFSTNISTNSGILNSNTTNFLTQAISTLTLSSGQVTTSTLTLFDIANNSQQVLATSNGQLFINGNPLIPGSGVLPTQLFSSIAGLGQAGYVSTPSLVSTVRGLGNVGYVSTASLVSTVRGLGTAGYVSTATLNTLVTSSIVSSIAGLGTVGYISTAGLDFSLASTVTGLGTAGYLSSAAINDTIVSTVAGLGTAGYVSTLTLNALSNTIFSPLTYISTGNLLSTSGSLLTLINSINPDVGSGISSFVVYGTTNFFSTVSIGVYNLYIQDVSTLSTAVGVELNSISTNLSRNSYGWAFSSQLTSTVTGLGGTGVVSTGQLTSSIVGLGTVGYISSSQLQSTTAGLITNLFPPFFVSTIEGLGTYGYISSLQLVSTVEGLGLVGYVSSSQLASTVDGLGLVGYVSSSQLASTVTGLGTMGFLSSIQLVSTVEGLGTAGYLSTSQLVSSVIGLGTAGYVSTASLVSTASNLLNFNTGPLVSTVIGLGTIGYVSTSQLVSTVRGLGGTGLISTGQLVSSVIGLGTAGYVSTGNLLSANSYFFSNTNYISSGNLTSTTRGLLGSFRITNAGDVYVTNGTVQITTANDITYLSSFLYSTITYKGNNGSFNASNTGAIMYFSTANLQLDSFSSYITSKSLVSIETIPTILFDKLAYTLSDWQTDANKVPQKIIMSSFVQFGGRNFFSSQISETLLFPVSYVDNTSNIFSQPIKINLMGNQITPVYNQQPFTLSHYLPAGKSIGTTNGFSNVNVTCFFGSTNSVFLSIQNLP